MVTDVQGLARDGAHAKPSVEELKWFTQCCEGLIAQVERAIRGKRSAVELAVVCMLSEGHLLLEDVPGTGKTSLARAIASSIGLSWNRIQFTPDLLPSDVTGVQVFNQRSGAFEFHRGAVFANVVLGDEINRASPKTQSALLEVMEERQVTVDGEALQVPRPFMVIATQNPVEMDGTYALPEAQLDRFLIRTGIGYPDERAEAEILSSQRHGPVADHLEAVLTADHVAKMMGTASRVHVSPALDQYVVKIVNATRASPDVRLGASPRASLALMRASRTRAATQGRAFTTPEDVKALASDVLSHRLILEPEAELRGRSPEQIVAEALSTVPVPQTVTNRS